MLRLPRSMYEKIELGDLLILCWHRLGLVMIPEQEAAIKALRTLSGVVQYIGQCKLRGWRFAPFKDLPDGVYGPPRPAPVYGGFVATNVWFEELRLGQVPSDKLIAAFVVAFSAMTQSPDHLLALKAASRASQQSGTSFGEGEYLGPKAAILQWNMHVALLRACASPHPELLKFAQKYGAALDAPADIPAVQWAKSLCKQCGGLGKTLQFGADCSCDYCPSMSDAQVIPCPTCKK